MLLCTAKRLRRQRTWVYVLACAGEKFYVGFTKRLHNRLADHFAGVGAVFTKLNHPLRVVALHPATSEADEFRLWCIYAERYGWSRVGGWNIGLCEEFNFEWPYPPKITDRKKSVTNGLFQFPIIEGKPLRFDLINV